MELISIIKNTGSTKNLVKNVLNYVYKKDFKEIYDEIEEEYKSINEKLKDMLRNKSKTRIYLNLTYKPINVIIKQSHVIAYLIKNSFIDLKVNIALVSLLEDKYKTLYLPGLLKFYFKQLNDVKIKNTHRQIIINIIAMILVNNEVEDVGLVYIYEFLYLNRSRDFVILYFILLNSKYDRFYREQLILNDVDVDYKVESNTSLEVIDKLLKSNNFEYNDELYESLRGSYYKKKFIDQDLQIRNILVSIQEKYSAYIKNPILELLPVNDENTRSVLSTKDRTLVKIYLQRVKKVNLGVTIWYLINDPVSCKREEIRNYINEHYEDILDCFYIRITNILDKSSKVKEIKELKEENNNAICEVVTQSETNNYSIDEILLCSINLSRYITYGIEDMINLYLRVIDLYKDKDVVYKVLVFVNSLIQKLKFDYEFLFKLFYRIVYLDFDCVAIRSIKYKIINKIIIFYDHNRSVIKELQKNFPLEIIADLWEEISLDYEILELESLLILLASILRITKNFYVKRILSNCLIDTLINDHKVRDFNETKRLRYNAFIEFLFYLSSLDIPKEYFRKILIYVAPFYRLIDIKRILDLLIETDPFYFYYIVFENDIKFSNDFTIYVKDRLLKKLSSTS